MLSEAHLHHRNVRKQQQEALGVKGTVRMSWIWGVCRTVVPRAMAASLGNLRKKQIFGSTWYGLSETSWGRAQQSVFEQAFRWFQYMLIWTLGPGPCGSVGWSAIPYTERVWVQFPVKGTYLGCRFDPQLGHVGEATYECFSSHIDISLFPPFAPL